MAGAAQLPGPASCGAWCSQLFDTLHVPLFGIIGLLLFAALKHTVASDRQRAVVALTIAFAIGAASEGVQVLTSRTASLSDLLLDWAGATGFLLIYLGFFRDGVFSRRGGRYVGILGAICLVIVTLPFMRVSVAYADRYRQLPTLIPRDEAALRLFVEASHSIVELDPESTSSASGLRVILGKGQWPGLIMSDPWPDWSAWSTFVIDYDLTAEATIELTIRVEDERHRLSGLDYNDRFNHTTSLKPGRHSIRIPIESILAAPTGRSMDIARIDRVVLFSNSAFAGHDFTITDIRLE